MITQMGCLLGHNYFQNYYEITVTNLSKQQALDANPKSMQHINYTKNLARVAGARIFFHY